MPYSRISSQDAKSIIDNGTVSIVDIRDENSFAAGHMLAAQHLDNAGLARFINDSDWDVPVIVCCYHGNMSQSAGAMLAEQGFSTVYSLDGGYTEWLEKYPAQCEAGR